MSNSADKIVYYHTDHGPELYARALRFTDEERRWRKQAARFVQNHPLWSDRDSIPGSLQAKYDQEDDPSDRRKRILERRWYRDQLTEILRTLNIVSEVLQIWFGNTDCVKERHRAEEPVDTRSTDSFPADPGFIRTLNRLGPFEPLRFRWQEARPREAEPDLSVLIPPHIRGNLQRNLLTLARSFCRPRDPLCQQCELRKFCSHYRMTQQSSRDHTQPTAIDVFAGAGGFSLGLEQAGFEVVAALDNDPDAICSYRLNHPRLRDEAVIEADARDVEHYRLAELLDGRDLDLLAGGPPCQGFSLMGNRIPHRYTNEDKKFGAAYEVEEDERNHLFRTIIRFARHLQPRYVIIENVPGLASAEIREISFAEHIAKKLASVGYDVQVLRLEATNFGIPQRRHRYFVVGTRYGNVVPNLDRLAASSEPTTTLEHALYDLPPLDVADGRWIARHNKPSNLDQKLFAPYLGRYGIRGQTCVLYNHVSRYNNEDDVELYSHLEQGENYTSLVERLTKAWGEHPSFARYSTETFHDKYFRLEWEGQSKTIVSHLKKDGNSYVHPGQNRSISVREAARLQSFPDEYIFCGSRGPQFVQIGNAVPPVMARAIGEVVLDAMRGVDEGPVAVKESSSQVQTELWDNCA